MTPKRNPALDALRRNVSGKVASGGAEAITEIPATHQRFAPVGSLVLSGYWGTVDRVLAHVTHGDWRGESVVVVEVAHPLSRNTASLGRVREHSTPFDPKHDRIVGTVES